MSSTWLSGHLKPLAFDVQYKKRETWRRTTTEKDKTEERKREKGGASPEQRDLHRTLPHIDRIGAPNPETRPGKTKDERGREGEMRGRKSVR
ncbi:hypothetical protein ANANG_G00222770 [Anguilla anguilla]|uniref:Uncharacterized protein n=1 Tax=Anguilla anguilla TaxID=7936 RepID=A0A9D3RQ89_ANGAN|nr:hypothetical protein ANANG_G00222770 [Anguilla anguilla]